MSYFDNFNELKNWSQFLAQQLLEKVGAGEWQNYPLYYYEDTEQFAKNEVANGWYANLGLNDQSDFNGAPNLFDYIDFESLGDDLTCAWDDDENIEIDGHVITSDYGWN